MQKKYTGRKVVAFILGFILTMFFAFRFDGTAKVENKLTISYNSFQDDAIGVVNIQLQIAKDTYSQTQAYNQKADTPLSAIERANMLLQKNIVELLKETENKTKTLFGHIQQMQWASDELFTLEQELQIQIVEANAKRSECEQQKTTADTYFSNAIDEKNTPLAEKSIQDAQTRGSCATKERIKYNAYNILKQSMEERRKLLDEKSLLLEVNSDLITKNFELFEDETLMLEQLRTVKNKLENIERRAKILQ